MALNHIQLTEIVVVVMANEIITVQNGHKIAIFCNYHGMQHLQSDMS